MFGWKPHETHRATFFEMVTRELQEYAPEMKAQTVGSTLIASGLLPLYSEGQILDHFDVELKVFGGFPKSLPEVRVKGSRIEAIEDNHFMKGGVACLEVPENMLREIRSEADFGLYLRKFVNGFFAAQFIKEKTGQFDAQWEHRAIGRLDYYYENFPETKGKPDKVVALLNTLLKSKLKAKHPCPLCGGLLENCHLGAIRRAKAELPKNVLGDARIYALDMLRIQAAKKAEVA